MDNDPVIYLNEALWRRDLQIAFTQPGISNSAKSASAYVDEQKVAHYNKVDNIGYIYLEHKEFSVKEHTENDCIVEIPTNGTVELIETLRQHYQHTPIVKIDRRYVHYWSGAVIAENDTVYVIASMSLNESLITLKKNYLTRRWKVRLSSGRGTREEVVHAHPSWNKEKFREYYGMSFVDAEPLEEATKKYKNVGSKIVSRINAFKGKRLKSIPYGFNYSMSATNNWSGATAGAMGGGGNSGGGSSAAGSGGSGGAVGEAAYQGNVGAMEVAKFYQVATEEQIYKLKQLIKAQDHSRAWQLIQRVVGVRLQGDEFK